MKNFTDLRAAAKPSKDEEAQSKDISGEEVS